MIRYQIDATATPAHTFVVTLDVEAPAARQQFSLPAWIPGSYLVREFARHLSALVAEQGGRPVALHQEDKATWTADCVPGQPLRLRYRVYAFDNSVRAAFLDAGRGFFNATSLCLRVHGQERERHELCLALPEGWDVATAMQRDPAAAAPTFVAADYDELVDHPFELGRFWRGTFAAGGVGHEFVVAGAWPDFDGDRLLADSARICSAAIAFWHGGGPPPFVRYVFMLNAVEEGRGGLEHRASTALIAPRRGLPRRPPAAPPPATAVASEEPSDAYVDLLGLISHEYFHTWNVKRLRPREFARVDYTRENYTELLWFFEGFTSYYDDLLVLRSGLIEPARYCKLIGETMTTVAAAPGRSVQSVAEASFDAWVKYYRADENTPNATISYYTKGSLVALALDLTLRSEAHGSLDDVMRRLWQTSGGGPIDEAQIAGALEAVGRRSYARELAEWVHGTVELPLAALLARFALDSERQPATLAQRLGVRVSESALTGIKVTHVLRDGAGERAGLAAGDELLGIDDWRLRRLEDAARIWAGEGRATLLVARGQQLLRLGIEGGWLAGVDAGNVRLRPDAAPTAEASRLGEAWLRG